MSATVPACPVLADGAPARPGSWRELPATEFLESFRGRAYEGVYPDGIGFREEIRADLSLVYNVAGKADSGRVAVRDGAVCFSYVIDAGPFCYVVWQRSANCYDGYVRRVPPQSGATALDRTLGLAWDVRFWRLDAPPTCPAMATS